MYFKQLKPTQCRGWRQGLEPLRKGWKRFNGIKDSSTGSKEFSSKPIRGSALHFLAQRFLLVQLLGPLVQLLRPTRCAQRAGRCFPLAGYLCVCISCSQLEMGGGGVI
jgi:hypothetical protein